MTTGNAENVADPLGARREFVSRNFGSLAPHRRSWESVQPKATRSLPASKKFLLNPGNALESRTDYPRWSWAVIKWKIPVNTIGDITVACSAFVLPFSSRRAGASAWQAIHPCPPRVLTRFGHLPENAAVPADSIDVSSLDRYLDAA